MSKIIKESNKKVSYEEEDDWIGKSIIQQMEEEWPQMTAEIRR